MGYDDASMIDVQCALLRILLLQYGYNGYSFNLEGYDME